MPWQWNDIILPLYGWHKPDGTRRFKSASIWIPKKNGKSTLMSGLCLWHLLEQKGSEVYCIASDVAQAGIVYNESANMVELSPSLKTRWWTRRNIKAIEDKKNKSTYRVLSSTPEGKAGFNANLIVYDELACWGSHARDVWDQLKNATIARVNGLQIVISTAQYDREHIGYEQYTYAKRILKNEIVDTTVLPVIYEVEDDEDWKQEANWRKANPSVGTTISIDSFKDDYREVENNPIEESRFRTLRLNQWVGHTKQWIASNVWQECIGQLSLDDFKNEDCILAVDLARRHDLAVYVLLFKRGDKVYVFPRFYMPLDNARKKEKQDNVPYTRWANQGLITLTPGDSIDYQTICNDIIRDSQEFNIMEVRYDPYNAESLRQHLEEQGLYCVEVKQSSTMMSAPTSEFERRLLKNQVRHPDHPILNWNLGNITIREVDTEGRIMIDKKRSSGRIDGIVATVIGFSGIMAAEEFGDFEMPFQL
ncbi:MAG: terminase TerL endonuclease subunit [Pirellulaceae bacterium]